MTVGIGLRTAREPLCGLASLGKTAYIVASSGTVTPIRTATNKALKPIQVGAGAGDIAITPNGRTAYVSTSAGVVPINTATNKPGKLIKIPGGTGPIVITPG